MQIVWIILIFINFITLPTTNGTIPLYPQLTNQILSTTNELCRNDSELLQKGLSEDQLWAFQMWDASQKDVVGISPGMTYQLGHYDECMSVKTPIKSKYCLVNVRININYTLSDPYNLDFQPEGPLYEKIQYTKDPNKVKRNMAHIGLCIPDSCTSQDVRVYLQNYLNQKYDNTLYDVSITDSDCNNNEKELKFNFYDIVFCIMVIGIILIVILCTVIDSRKSQKIAEVKNEISKYISCFSLIDNINELNRKEGNPALNVLYGMKFCFMICVITGHLMIVTLTGPIYNFDRIEMENRDVKHMFICKGDAIVDLFFLLGGLLVTYGFFVQSEKKIVHPLKSIILRYCRIMPIFAFLTFFYATIFYKLGSGPLWNQSVGEESKNCQINWWTNLLFLNNYININNMCILQAWYLPCDFHLFILSIPLNNLLRKNEKHGLIVLSILLGLSILSPFLITYIWVKEPFVFVFNDYFKTLRHSYAFQKMYVPTHTRASTYIIGMFFGYFYYKLKNKKYEMSTVKSLIMIPVSSLICFACILSAAIFYNPYREYSLFESSLYAAIHRPVFALFGGIMIFSIGYSSFPYFRSFFNYYPMIPLGKLSFGAYMTHMLFQYIRIGNSKSTFDMSNYNWICYTFIDVSFGLLTSLILFLLIENPLVRIVKLLLPTDRAREIHCKNYENSITINTQI